MKRAKPIDPGKTDKKIEILRRSSKPGSQGQPRNDWNVCGDFWAAIETLSGVEVERVGRKFPTCGHRIIANWDPMFEALHPSDRLRWGKIVFDLSHVENVNFEDVRLEVLATQLVERKSA